MDHLENIKKLFGKNFVEHPLLESFDTGRIYLPTGHLVASDPLTTHSMKAFSTVFPVGSFPVQVHKERESNCIAYVEIIFAEEQPVRWEMALTDGQQLADLGKDEIFGYPVESGMGCFMDLDTQEELNRLEIKLHRRQAEDFMGIYEAFFHDHFFDENGAIDQYAFLKPNEEKPGNIFAFETGYGEGFYASYIGFNANNEPVKVISEFIEILSQ